jgi:hypothetical protein
VQLFQPLKPVACGGGGVLNGALPGFGRRSEKSLICDNLTAKRFPKPSV